MYCQECGKQNDDRAIVCQECGILLERDFEDLSKEAKLATQKAAGKAIKATGSAVKTVRKNKKAQIAILCACIVVVLIGSVFAIGNSLTNPERIVKKYFESYMDGDYAKAYEYLAMPDSEFLSKKAYATYMEQTVTGKTVSQYEISESSSTSISSSSNTSSSKELTKRYTVKYLLTGESTTNSFSVTLVLQENKKFIFFDDYSVAVDDFIVKNFTVYAPDGLTISVDGIGLKSEKSTDDYGNPLKVYTIPYAYKGTHELAATSDAFEDYTDTFSLSNDGSTIIRGLEIKESVRDEMANTAETLFTSWCTNAIEEISLSEADFEMLTSVSTPLGELTEVYYSLQEHFNKEDGTGLKSIAFQFFEDVSTSTNVNNDYIYECRLKFTYSYVKLYLGYAENIIVGEENEQAPQGNDPVIMEESSDGTREGSVRIRFIYEDGTFKVYSIDNYSINY